MLKPHGEAERGPFGYKSFCEKRMWQSLGRTSTAAFPFRLEKRGSMGGCRLIVRTEDGLKLLIVKALNVV